MSKNASYVDVLQILLQMQEQLNRQQTIQEQQVVIQDQKYQEVFKSLKSMREWLRRPNTGKSEKDGTSTSAQHELEPQHVGVANNIPRTSFLRLELPRFDGSDASGWIFCIQEYFDYHNTPDDQRIKVVAFNLEGKASDWYQLMKGNHMLSTWPDFLDAVRLRFGPSQFEDFRGKLSKLTQ